jgi:hypothetical protein
MSRDPELAPRCSRSRSPHGRSRVCEQLSRDGHRGVVVFGRDGMSVHKQNASKSAKDVILESMGPIERLSALKLWWWLKREGGTVLRNILGEKGTSVLALIGMFMLTWIGAEQTGQIDLIPAEIEVKVAMFVAFMQSLGLFGAKDAKSHK